MLSSKEWYELQLWCFAAFCMEKIFANQPSSLLSNFQGILLDEADGVNRSQQPVMPAGFQPPKIVVSSWNRKVG